MSASPNYEEKSGIWTVHSEFEKRPSLRGFRKTKAEAEKLMAELKAEDPDSASTEYWLIELTHGALEDFRSFGMLPPGF